MLSSFPARVALRDSEACNATPTDRMSSGVALAALRSCVFPQVAGGVVGRWTPYGWKG